MSNKAGLMQKHGDLPITAVMGDIIVALRQHGRAVLQAPPGAGKTTAVPLALARTDLCQGKIIVLEPRRLATRAAAERMASTLGEEVGQTIGYRMRGQSKVSPKTRVEIITEGILTRMIQSDPELPGVSAIIFDEFHERSLAADLGLALAWDIRQNLRDDLMIMVMSATLDAGPVAKLMDDAPVITAQGRSFPVDIEYLDRPLHKSVWFENSVADLVVQAAGEQKGGILVFLPGEGEIRRVQNALSGRLPAGHVIRPLLGALPFAQQRKAILLEENPKTTKVVLSTAIAETSLTIQDIRVVIDAGLARHAVYTPSNGLSKLETMPVSRATATQRAGRAGRVAAGKCYRLWAKVQDGTLPAFPPAEIETADLAPLVLELAAWGSAPDDLAFLTPPPKPALNIAQDLLERLGAIQDGRITAHGRALAQIPLHPRLANMMVRAGASAAPIAALLSNRNILASSHIDLTDALRALRGDKTIALRDQKTLRDIQAEAKRLAKITPDDAGLTPVQALALAYPDRVAQRRKGGDARFLLSGGFGAVATADDPLANAPFLVVADMGGAQKKGRDANIRRALPITLGELKEIFEDQITWSDICIWSKRDGRVLAQRQEKLGALTLQNLRQRAPAAADVLAAMLDGIAQLGMILSKKAVLLQARAMLVRSSVANIPDVSTPALLENAAQWLPPFIGGLTTAQDWKGFDHNEALRAYIGWENLAQIDRIAPADLTTPLGRKIAIDYGQDVPQISIRLQEMFGQTRHPMVSDQSIKITLLSPAQRPIQVTTDIAGFWRGSYADVRKDMRAQYPRHPWPEDPTQSDPTLRAKPRV